jgi:phage terminase large subunit-like protein
MAKKKHENELYYFDEQAANLPIEFIETFCFFTSGENKGKPLKLEEFQKDLIRNAFGWKQKINGRRRYKFIYLEVPKGNGKSYLLSAIGLYLQTMDGEPNCEVYAVAGNKDQARIIFEASKEIVAENPFLASKFQIFRDSIYHNKSASKFKVLSSDDKGHHGYRPHGILFDEMHVQPNRDLYDTLSKGIIKKDKGMVWMITTAGRVGTFAHDMHEYAKKIEAGKIKNDYWYVKIYGAAPDDDPFSPVTWKKANPGLKTIIKPENFDVIVQEAKTFPSALTSFKQLHLNIWTGSNAEWIADHEWQDCDFGEVSWADLKGKECWGGLDLASVRDTTCLHYYFPNVNGKNYCLPFYFIPKETVEIKTKTENANYSTWVRDGKMIATPGNATDYDFVKAKIKEVAEHCKVQAIAFDRWNSSQLVSDLIVEGFNLTPFGQGFVSMSTPTKELERQIIERELNHGGHPVTRWQMSNVQLTFDPAGNVKVNKEGGKRKIDGVVALIMAMGEQMQSAEKNKKSIYETRDMLFF